MDARSKVWVCSLCLLGLRFRIPSGARMSVCCKCCVLSGRGRCDGLITRPEESYRVWCVWVLSWSLDNEEALAYWEHLRHGEKIATFRTLVIFISVFNQLDAQNLFHNKFYFMPLHVSSTCAHHQEVKIALHSLWYHYTYRWPSRTRGVTIPEAV